MIKKVLLLPLKCIWVLGFAVCALTACESNDKPEPIAQECSEVKVVVHIPDGTMPSYTTRTADSQYALRGVAEVYVKGSDQLLLHQAVMLTPTAQTDVFYMMLDSLPQNDLDVYMWTDYSADISDLYYDTQNLRGIRFNDVGEKAGDYVFVTGSESSVTINIDVVNPATEEVIASAENVEIDYRQGYVTTVSGDFLTADSNLDGNIGITTRWDGEYNVEF